MPKDTLSPNPICCPEHAFREMMVHWRLLDLDAVFTHIHPDAIHEVNIDGATIPQLSSTQGAGPMRQRFQYIIDTFEFAEYEIKSMRTDGDVINSTLIFRFRHRRTGEELASSFRLLATWNDGQFTRFQEFVDEAFVAAFMRLTGEIE